ncbi:phospholipid hydroperoxide glutathione peroxidase-like [Raphidocelis subcapitata]|uniref:Glutathione peroxidase n=1 Tax=Raphidocelis subcapitata TaxID=307507 RepID=A0A2V0PKW7_9CHLO|nr:phospholipid hydroperoxide glutathione peroxidase-like [Raphidocelis subcapitata]|eukprot:GBF98663.1 phospholipid hydroperoxide glutathione peroxidase-like [Raphidocelis subcapitata]
MQLRGVTCAQRPAFGASRPRAVRVMASKSLYDSGIKVKTLEGEDFPLEKLKGKVALITNVACKCGLTNSNYTELVALYDKYKGAGLEVLAFPSNEFGRQEPGTPAQIRDFVSSKYGVAFPVMEKIETNGPNTHPVYKLLKEASGDDSPVDWNFRGKFVVDKDGNVVKRTGDNPAQLEPLIKELLAA